MSEPTICANCAFCIKTHLAPIDTQYDMAKCEAAYEDGIDYVSGASIRAVKRGDHEWCFVRNKAGNCKDYQPKENR